MIRRTLRLLLRIALVLVLLGGIAFVALRLTNPRPGEAEGWERLTDLPLARGEVAAAVTPKGKLYVIGGLRGTTGTTDDSVDIYDIEADQWSKGPRLAPLHHAAASAAGRHIYVSGGATSATNWAPSKRMWRLDGDEVKQMPDMPEGRQGHAMVNVHGVQYIVGGVGKTDDTLMFVPAVLGRSKAKWLRLDPLPMGRDHLRAVAVNETIWAIGGRSGGEPVTRVDRFSTGHGGDYEWTRGPDLPEPMSAMAVGLIGDELHVVGGEDPDPVRGGVLRDHFVLKAGAKRWARAPSPPLDVHGAGYAVYEDKLYITGGASRQGALSTISWTGVTQVFDPSDR